MQEVARELQGIKQIQEEAKEEQRQSFQMGLKGVRGKLELWESKSKSVDNEIRLLMTPGQRPAPRKPAAKKTQQRLI